MKVFELLPPFGGRWMYRWNMDKKFNVKLADKKEWLIALDRLKSKNWYSKQQSDMFVKNYQSVSKISIVICITSLPVTSAPVS